MNSTFDIIDYNAVIYQHKMLLSAFLQGIPRVFLRVLVLLGVAIAERLAPFKVKKFIYTDVAPRPELANTINAEYGKTWIMVT